MNTIGYFEIQSSDPVKAVEFYSTVFGWKCTLDPAVHVEYYRIEGAGMMGAILKVPMEKPPKPYGTNAFTCSIQVPNYDAAAEQILKLGGLEALPKFAIPGKCYQGYYVDIDRNVFGIFEVDEDAK